MGRGQHKNTQAALDGINELKLSMAERKSECKDEFAPKAELKEHKADHEWRGDERRGRGR